MIKKSDFWVHILTFRGEKKQKYTFKALKKCLNTSKTRVWTLRVGGLVLNLLLGLWGNCETKMCQKIWAVEPLFFSGLCFSKKIFFVYYCFFFRPSDSGDNILVLLTFVKFEGIILLAVLFLFWRADFGWPIAHCGPIFKYAHIFI